MAKVRIPSWAIQPLLLLLAVVGIVLLVGAVLIGIVLAIVLFPVIALVNLMRGGVGYPWSVPAGAGGGAPSRSCPTCGYSLRGLGMRGVCPECNTVFGFDVEVRHEVVEAPQLPPAEKPPIDADRR